MTTIREHNATRHTGFARKADYIVGMTIDGAFYCADCIGDSPAEPTPGPYGPTPVFSSDSGEGFTCDDCFEVKS